MLLYLHIDKLFDLSLYLLFLFYLYSLRKEKKNNKKKIWNICVGWWLLEILLRLHSLFCKYSSRKWNPRSFLLTVGKLTSWGLHNSKFEGVYAVCEMLTSSNAGCICNKVTQLGSLEMRWGKVKWRTEWEIIGFMHQCLERERERQRERNLYSWP